MASPSHPDISSSSIALHPVRPVIVWAAGKFLFSLNLKTGNYECWRLAEQSKPIRSIDYFSSETPALLNDTSLNSNSWVVTSDDKTVVVLKDETFKVEERFLFRKRPTAVKVCDNGGALIWGDKFGELFKLSICETRMLTQQVVQDALNHFARNKKDNVAVENAKEVLSKFNVSGVDESTNNSHDSTVDIKKSNDMSVNGTANLNNDDSEAKENNENDEDSILPFAGHMAAITALEITSDGERVISADRDEKIRIGSVKYPHITIGYGLGHREFITSICSPDDLPHLLVSGSGDRTLRLWEQGDNVSGGCRQLDVICLPAIPSVIKYLKECKSFLIVCESFEGVIQVLLHETDVRFNPEINILSLPTAPLSVLPVALTSESAQFSVFKNFKFNTNDDSATDALIPAFYWVDREGRLHLPRDVATGKVLFESAVESQNGAVNPPYNTWQGCNIGEPIITESVQLWKHNRAVLAESEEELRKRIKH